MKRILLTLAGWFLTLCIAYGQVAPVKGTISYVTGKNVYVRFEKTEQLQKGDTLYLLQKSGELPALVIDNLSSISAVCTPIVQFTFKAGDQVSAKTNRQRNKTATEETAQDTLKLAVKTEKTGEDTEKPGVDSEKPGAAGEQEKLTEGSASPVRVEKFTGRISAAMYSNLTNTPAGNNQRMRYSLSLNDKYINGSPLSAETYISFVHRSDRWEEIKSNIFHGLKIYNLSVHYQATENLNLIFGRKINPRLSNMGAVDGLQAEYRIKSFKVGALAGSRPDFEDYSFNTGLFQYGMFLSHDSKINGNAVQTTVSFVEQKNKGLTDRRFAYLQHYNTLARNLYFFGSLELNLFRPVLETTRQQQPLLSNIYLNFRYRVMHNLSVSLAYSQRTNIIYYETYKTFLEQLLERETQQGYMAQINYRVSNKISFGANGGYRNSKSDPEASKNAYVWFNYNSIPVLKLSATLSGNYIKTGYLTGNILGIQLSRDIFKSKVYSSLAYRYQNYLYAHSETHLVQHAMELGLSWRIIKKLSLSANLETTLDDKYTYHRLYLQLAKRF